MQHILHSLRLMRSRLPKVYSTGLLYSTYDMIPDTYSINHFYVIYERREIVTCLVSFPCEQMARERYCHTWNVLAEHTVCTTFY